MPYPDGSRTFRIDAVTGWADCNRRFNQRDDVRIVVSDVNPFLFTYTITAQGRKIAEASPGSFFNLALGLGTPTALISASDTSRTDRGVPENAGCPLGHPKEQADAAEAAFRSNVDEWHRLDTVSKSLRRRLMSLDAVLRAEDREYRTALTTVMDARSDAPAVQAAAREAAEVLAEVDVTLTDSLPVLEADLRPFYADVNRFVAIVSPLRTAHPLCRNLSAIVSGSAELRADSARYAVRSSKMEERRVAAAAGAVAIFTTATDFQRFFAAARLPRYNAPHDVEIVVQRKSFRPAAGAVPSTVVVTTATPAPGETKPLQGDTASATVGRYFINVGGTGRLSAGAGVAWTPIPVRQYAAVTRVLPVVSGLGGDTIRTITRSEDSPGRLIPMLTLNTRLAESSIADVHLVLGVGPTTSGKTTIEYLFGAGASFFEHRILVSTGVFLGRLTSLSDGFAVDGTLPRGTTTPPTRTDLAHNLGIAVTYRVAPW